MPNGFSCWCAEYETIGSKLADSFQRANTQSGKFVDGSLSVKGESSAPMANLGASKKVRLWVNAAMGVTPSKGQDISYSHCTLDAIMSE
jgi:hypothetical protein